MERANRFLQSRRGRLVLAAGGMALILCAVYAACGFWPFGPNSVMTGDLNSQYIPFYAHFYDAVRGGGSLFYADDLGLGGGAFALFAYYFASPFAWLYLLIAPEFYGQLCCIVWALKVILAAADGTVSEVGFNSKRGNYVVIDHGDGTTTLYAHMSSRAVSEGELVQQGQTIGAVGTTGNVKGAHLHFEVRINGQRTDPEAYYTGLPLIRAYNW